MNVDEDASSDEKTNPTEGREKTLPPRDAPSRVGNGTFDGSTIAGGSTGSLVLGSIVSGIVCSGVVDSGLCATSGGVGRSTLAASDRATAVGDDRTGAVEDVARVALVRFAL